MSIHKILLASQEINVFFFLILFQKNIVNCIIQNCGTKFWHCMLPSSTLLLKDFIDACGSIDKEVNLKIPL